MRKSYLFYTVFVFLFAYAPAPVEVLAQESSLETIEGISKRTINKAKRKRKKKTPASGVDLAQVCKKVQPFRGALLKSAWPGHIQRNDPRASGFALVCAQTCPKKFPVNAYYSDGEPAFRIGYYGRWEGNGKPRGYCAVGGAARCIVSVVQRDSKKSGRDGKVYVDFGGGSCMTAIPGNRNGDV